MKKPVKIKEMMASGDVFGTDCYGKGDYAPGDARIPKVLGPIITRQGKIRGKRKKTLFDSFFNQSFETEPNITIESRYVLTVTKKNFERIIEGIIQDNTEQYDTVRTNDGSLQFLFFTENENMYAITNRINGLFNDNVGKSIHLHLEQISKLEEDKVPGGLADDMTCKDVAKSIKEPVKAVKKSVKMGAKVEREHTNDPDIAKEIARDHVKELGSAYYPALDKMEKKLKRNKI